MDKRGGARPGAGRKPLSKQLKKIDPKLINAGVLPLEMYLRVSRHLWSEATDPETGAIKDIAKAKEAAEFAEPALAFTSNRLQAVAHTHANPDGSPIKNGSESVLADVRSLIALELTRKAQPA